LNSQPLTLQGLRGKVVLLDFWTLDCANCIQTLPHIRQLHAKYSGPRFILIGVHTPEFEFEKDLDNVASAVKRFRIEYPVAIDNENATWKLYGNQYWPRQTLVDARGRVRWEHAGEGDYEEMEKQIRALLKENRTESTSR
jgi:thiol-disulfide isomerase/thioredoxin